MSTEFPTIKDLKRALEIEEKIELLRDELRSIFGLQSAAPATGELTPKVKKKDGRSGKRSAATRAKMAAAQKARHAKKSASSASTGEHTTTSK